MIDILAPQEYLEIITMVEVADTIRCRMLCASGCAYGIDPKGKYTPPSPYHEAVGWVTDHPPVPVFGGDSNINACLVGANNIDGIVVAFRGTLPPTPVTISSLIDWWQDIVDSKPEHEGSIPGKVHHGFWDAINSIWPQIVEQVGQFQNRYPDKRLYLTGHSKGGPMASISAARIHFDQAKMLQPAAVYTYASPHPGDTGFVGHFPLSTIPVSRYENYLDIVPFLPPTQEFIDLTEKIPLIGDLFKKAAGWNYAPLGTLQYVKEDHRIVGNGLVLEAVRLAELVEALSEGEKGLMKIADAHSHACGGGYMSGICPTGVCS
jgi:hypothetical protein